MRLAIITALSALATLAMVSGASAQNDQRVSDQSHVRAIHAPTVGDENGADADAYSADASGPTMEQEDAIPYHPCAEPLGWVNGRLRCRND